MNVPALVALPPGVVMAILPVTAPLGTIAVTLLSEFTVKLAFTPPKVTLVVCLRLTPVMVTEVPAEPVVGEKPVICGMTRNSLLLFNVPLEVVTVTRPVPAPLGTVAVKKVPDTTVRLAVVPLKDTVVVDVKPCPKNSIVAATLPE